MIDQYTVHVRGRRSRSGRYYPGKKFDLSHYATGRTLPAKGVRSYSGRPQLAAQIVSAVRGELPKRGRFVVADWTLAMSYFWQALDIIEARDTTVQVSDVADIPGKVWDAFDDLLDEDNEISARKAATYKVCRMAVTKACANAGIRVELPKNPHSRMPSARRAIETPYSVAMEEQLIDVFRTERLRTVRRWRLANTLADAGTSALSDYLLSVQRGVRNYKQIRTRENILHFVRGELLQSLPDITQFNAKYQIDARTFTFHSDAMSLWRGPDRTGRTTAKEASSGLAALYRWFLPTKFDLVPIICEMVHRTGANLATILDIDRNDWSRVDRHTGEVLVYSRKSRSKGAVVGWDSTLGDEESIYNIIKTVIQMTAPIHDWTKRRLGELRLAPKTPEVIGEIDQLIPYLDSVWLALGARPIAPVYVEGRGTPIQEMASEILRQRDIRERGENVQWSAHRVRDSFAEKTYKSSNHSPRRLQTAMVHTSSNTGAVYLDQPELNLEQSETIRDRMIELMDDAFSRHLHWPDRPSGYKKETKAPGAIVLVMPAGFQHAFDEGILGSIEKAQQ